MQTIKQGCKIGEQCRGTVIWHAVTSDCSLKCCCFFKGTHGNFECNWLLCLWLGVPDFQMVEPHYALECVGSYHEVKKAAVTAAQSMQFDQRSFSLATHLGTCQQLVHIIRKQVNNLDGTACSSLPAVDASPSLCLLKVKRVFPLQQPELGGFPKASSVKNNNCKLLICSQVGDSMHFCKIFF